MRGGYLTEAVRRKPYSLILLASEKGAQRCVQYFAAGAGRREANRRPRPHRRFQQLRVGDDVELGFEAIQAFTQDAVNTKDSVAEANTEDANEKD